MKNDFNYKLVRTVAVPTFKLCLRPKIINAENIPATGPVLLCGNHLHVWDQFPVICATKRVTHWMAKKEYFDGKLGPFFRATGAIPVDRFGDPHASTEIAIEYLKNGEIVGIFPEGTRNQYEVAKIKLQKLEQELNEKENSNKVSIKELNDLKEKIKIAQNEIIIAKETVKKKGNEVIENEELLPFKFGAVSMAQKTNATIIPSALTGDYKFHSNNLIIRFGKGFKVPKDMDLKEANNRLEKEIEFMMIKNLNDTNSSIEEEMKNRHKNNKR